ncbi:MAG: sugar phosphate isomerase/epimerase family protein [Candidatus Hodarchaeota archaeon]
MSNSLSFSSSPLNKIIGTKYYDLESTLTVMKNLWTFSIIQGFEFQHLAEWNRNYPPKDKDPRYDRYEAWKDSKKYTIEEIAKILNDVKIPILSIHGNRDIGILCCSDNPDDIEDAKKLILDAVNLAELVGAKICVFHLWDTSDEKFDPVIQKEIIDSIAISFPKIRLSIENIPTSLKNYTPFDLVENFNWITLDLRWAALYDELNKFSILREKIVNVHIRGTLEGTEWKLKNAPFTIYEALDTIINKWNYKGIFTFEPEGKLSGATWDDLVKAINSIKKVVSASILE